MRRALVLAGLAAALLAAASATAQDRRGNAGTAAAKPVLEPTTCAWRNKLRRKVECFQLVVTEQRGKADSRKIRLAVARFRSPRPSKVPPVVLISGGPGATAALDKASGDYWNREVPRLTWLGNRDLIVYDQRGVGMSKPAITCPEFIVTRAAPLDSKLLLFAVERCRAVWRKRGLPVSAYDTNANAADLEDLRRALGYDRWVLWGQSYGSRVALATARRFPDGLAGMILDGVYPPQIGPKLHWAKGTVGAIDRIFKACAAEEYCARRYPKLWPRFDVLLRKLAKEPVTLLSKTKPVLPNRRHKINDVLFMLIVEGMIYTREGALKLPWLIDQLDRKGNWAALQKPLAEWDQISFGPFITFGANLSVDCNDNPVADDSDEKAIAAQRPTLRRWIRYITEPNICLNWTDRRTPSLDYSPVRSNVPAIIISGRLDPATPPEWARAAMRTLSRARLVSIADRSHDAIDDRCAKRAVAAFLANPDDWSKPACTRRPRKVYFD